MGKGPLTNTGRHLSARRREVRRTVGRSPARLRLSIRRRELSLSLALVVALTAVAGSFAIDARKQPRLRPGQAVSEPIISRVAFDAIDEQATADNRKTAYELEPTVYVANRAYVDYLKTRLAALIGLADYDSIDQVPEDYRRQINLDEYALAQLKRFVKDGEPAVEWQRITQLFLQELFDFAILPVSRYEAEKQQGYGRIVVMHPFPRSDEVVEQYRYENRWISVEDVDTLRENIESLARQKFPRALEQTIVAMMMEKPSPTYLYDAALTEQRKLARQEREPIVKVRYDANQMLVPAGVRLSAEQIDLVKAEHEAYERQHGSVAGALNNVGIVAAVLALVLAIGWYCLTYNRRVIENPMRGLALVCLMLLCQAVAVAATRVQPELVFALGTFPTLLAAMVLTIAYDRRFALVVATVHGVLVTLSLSQSLGFLMTCIAGVAVAVGLLDQVRTRSKLVQVGLASGLVMAAVAGAVSLYERPLHLGINQLRLVGYTASYALLSGISTGLLVQGILPIIERIFKVTTAMTLKELNDVSQPLLQRLAQEAPGTYQHSLRIADMAEAAAEAIGASGLLCRVGAMYHDIGKINKPMYFIENQGGGPNRHNKLSPAMSLLIIVGHVKDGIEMAREWALPRVVRHFIESHHGTTLVEYFYHAARKQTEAADQQAPSEFEFRYPGPKPQSKEAAIMLLCDGIEGAARTLAEPTPVRLEQVVHNMAMKRLMDGQFDECQLTLQELSRIEQAITKTLCAIYHGRIKYPGQSDKNTGGAIDRKADKPADESPSQVSAEAG